MNMNKVQLKFKSSMPLKLQNALVGLGFTYFDHKRDEWIIYEKQIDDDDSGVPKGVQQKLKRRIDNVINAYLDPYTRSQDIKDQCFKIASTLPKLEREWVRNWVTENIDSDFHSPKDTQGVPPWEDEDYMYNC